MARYDDNCYPRGPPGLAGPQGPTGPQGLVGPTGPIGPTGSALNQPQLVYLDFNSPLGGQVVSNAVIPGANPDGTDFGWFFSNLLPGSTNAKINWRFWTNGPNPPQDPASTASTVVNGWARLSINTTGTTQPLLKAYSAPLGDGQDVNPNYRSVATYRVPGGSIPTSPNQALIWFSADPTGINAANPAIFPQIPHIQATLRSFNGPTGQSNFLPNETMLWLTLETNRGGNYDLAVFSLGYNVNGIYRDLELTQEALTVPPPTPAPPVPL